MSTCRNSPDGITQQAPTKCRHAWPPAASTLCRSLQALPSTLANQNSPERRMTSMEIALPAIRNISLSRPRQSGYRSPATGSLKTEDAVRIHHLDTRVNGVHCQRGPNLQDVLGTRCSVLDIPSNPPPLYCTHA